MNELQHLQPEVMVQRLLFDYAALGVENSIIIQQRTSEIKERVTRIETDIVQIGAWLADVRARLEKGTFKQWLNAEFPEWSQRKAYYFIQVWEQYGSADFSIKKIAPSGLYLLAAPSTPDEARKTVNQLAQAGQSVSYSTVKKIVEQAKPKNLKQAELIEESVDIDYGEDDPLPIEVYVEKAELDEMDRIDACQKIDEGKPIEFYEYGGERVIITGSVSSGREGMISVDGWRIVPEYAVKDIVPPERGEFETQSYIGTRVNIGKKSNPNWWVVVGPQYEFKRRPADKESVDPSAICLCGCRAGAHTQARGQYGECRECECEIFQQATEEEIAALNTAEKALGIIRSKSPVPLPGATPTYETIARLKAEMELSEEAAKPASGHPGVCRVCGCTDRDCSQCIEKTGAPCYWVKDHLCSSCAPAGSALTPVIVEVEQAELDEMPQFNAVDEILDGEPVPIYDIDYGPVCVITFDRRDQDRVVEARGYRIIPEGEAGQFPEPSRKPGLVTSLIGYRVNINTKREPNWYVIVGPEYEFRLARPAAAEDLERNERDRAPAASAAIAHRTPSSGKDRSVPQTPSTEFSTYPEGWFETEIEIRIRLLPGGDAATRKLRYEVRVDEANDGEPFIAEHYGEDMLYFSLPAQAYKLLQQAAAAFVAGSATTTDKKELKRRALARYRGVPVESIEPEDEEALESEDEQEDYQAKWFAGLTDEEREKYDNAPCSCDHKRYLHDSDNQAGECSALNCGPTIPIARCRGFHCSECDTKGGHQSSCKHYVLGEGSPVQHAPEGPPRSPQVNDSGVYVKGLENITIPMPKKAGKTEVIINLVRDLADKMWRSSYSVRAGDGSSSSLPSKSHYSFESRELALLEAGEGAKDFMVRQIGRGDTTDAQKRQIEAATTALDEWIAINAIDHSTNYPDDEIEAEPEEFDLPQAEELTIEAALRHALDNQDGQWDALRQIGATDEVLRGEISKALGNQGGASACGGYCFKGGKNPQFSWPGMVKQPNSTTLKGKRLLAKAREVLGISAPKQIDNAPADADDFTATRCDECGRIDGAHANTCSKRPDILTFEDYLTYAEFTKSKAPKSWARKWIVSREMDNQVHAWKLYRKELENPRP